MFDESKQKNENLYENTWIQSRRISGIITVEKQLTHVNKYVD